jgi:hypothetical protein
MPNPKTHTITSRPDGKFKISNNAKKQKQSSVDKNWTTLSTKDKLDLLAEKVGLIDADGQVVVS